jgi:hypothetical protein
MSGKILVQILNGNEMFERKRGALQNFSLSVFSVNAERIFKDSIPSYWP